MARRMRPGPGFGVVQRVVARDRKAQTGEGAVEIPLPVLHLGGAEIYTALSTGVADALNLARIRFDDTATAIGDPANPISLR